MMANIRELQGWSRTISTLLATSAIAGSAMALGASAAQAQTAASSDAIAPSAGEPAAPHGPDDIVVTARRTEERLSRVPVAVSALGTKQLEERHIVTEADLQAATPGLTVRQTNSSNQVNFSLRGQSLDAFSFAAPAVLTYVNEFNAQGVAASSFYDLQSIQVLKGPQGTLFGRNATGGAVLYSTQAPEADLGGYAKIGYGNYNNRAAEGAINLPFGDDAGGFRLAGAFQRRDGYQNNLLLGTKNGSIDTFSIRPTLLLKSGRFTSKFVFQYTFSGGVSAGLRGTDVYLPGQVNNGYLLNPGVPSGAIYAPGVQVLDPRVMARFNGIVDYLNKQKGVGFYDIFNNQNGQHRGRQFLATNTTTYDLSDTFTLKNVIGFNYAKSHDNTDVDGTPYEPLTIGFSNGESAEGYTYIQRQFSEDMQLSGKLADGKLDLLVGGFYFAGLDHQRMGLCIGCDLAGGPLAVFLREYGVSSFSKAVYAQGTYHLTDRLNFTAGGRYTWELTKFRPDPLDIGAIGGVKAASLKGSKPSWTFSLDYRPVDSLMFYIAQRGSWRTGGFNGTATQVVDGVTVVNSFKPETTYDFEIGAKFNGRVGNMPANLNVAIYDQYIKNVIRAVYLGVSAVSGNAGAARVSGIEADGSIRLARWLQIGGTLAYTNARYTKPTATVGGDTVTFGPYGDVPKWAGSAFARASTELGNGLGELALRGDFYTQSKFYYTNAEATILPGTVISGYSLADARLELNNISGSRISLAGYVKNLTDKQYNVGGFGLGAVTGVNSVLPGLPRTYGIELSAKF